jgi:diguanylate cyclase (GGDEF)-like protein/PAS domain S-box-containing protein
MNLNSSPNSVLNNSDPLFKMIFSQQLQYMAVLSREGQVLKVNDIALTFQDEPEVDYIGKLFWESPAWCNTPAWEQIWRARLEKSSNQKQTVIFEDTFQIADCLQMNGSPQINAPLQIKNTIEVKKNLQVESSFQLAQSTIYYANTSITPLYTPENNDQPSGYIIQIVDITKQRNIENQHKKNETKLELVLEQSRIGNWELNLADQTTHHSLIHDQIFGYDSLVPDWTYETFLQHVLPEEKDEVDNKLQQAIANKVNWHIECRIRRKDGEIRWILASGGHTFDVSEQTKLIVGIVQDITDLKQAEETNLRHHAELKSLFNALPDTYFRIMSDGVILDYHTQNNDKFYNDSNNFIGKRLQDIFPEDIGLLFQSKINDVLQTDKILTFKYQLMINNQITYFDVRLNNIGFNDQLICIIRDVSNELRSQESLAVSEQLFRTIFEQATVGVALISFDIKSVIRINQRFCDMVGYSMKDMSDVNIFERITHPDDLESNLSHRKKILTGQQHESTIKKRYIHKDGHIIWVELTISPTRQVGSQPKTIIVVAQDISKRKKAEDKLQLSSKVFSDTHEGIVITDAKKLIVDVNSAFFKITGYRREEVIGKQPSFLSSGKQSPQFYEQMWQSIKESGHWQGEIWNRTKQGELYAELLNITSLTNEDNQITHYIGVFSDITSIKQQQEKLNLMAHYDVLTKLPNRALFIDRFHQSIAHSIRTGHQLAICFFDLDDFKPVNDSFGHDAGDHLLIEVAERITGCIREEDTVSRQGGDEFAILLNDIESNSQYEATIKRIHQILAVPYIIDGIQHQITVSSGVTLYPSDEGDIDTLLRHADHAMYQSKLAGKNRSNLYSPDSDQRIIQKNLQLEEINNALENNEFQLYYQPKVNMATGNVFGVEALIRWFHPEKGLLPPLDFLPFIDGTPLEIKVGEWVIKNALQQLDNWQQQGIKLEVSINIASNHLHSSSFFIVLEKHLAEHPSVNAKDLQLEILESSTLGDLNTITHIIKACQSGLGVTFALDDFGTGYSSLTHLRSLPAETIKIDQSFVRDVLDDPSDYSIIDGVISLTKSFNRNVIAEGVETTDHGLMLLLMGCEKAQGYGIAKPMPAVDFFQWLNHYTPNKEWLACGSTHYTRKQNTLEIFKLMTTKWKEKLRNKILSSHGDIAFWPILDNEFCHCGNWLYLQKQTQLFDEEEIQRIEEKHYKIHDVAYSIQHKYQTGKVQEAQNDLAALELVFKEMHNALSSESIAMNASKRLDNS